MVRGVPIGGGAAIPVQSMTTAKTDDWSATLREVERLEEAGCQIVRITVPNQAAAEGFAQVRKRTELPLAAGFTCLSEPEAKQGKGQPVIMGL